MRVGNITIEVSKTDKVLFPEDKITKGDLIEYYAKVAPIMVPLIKGRPIAMHRFPDGIKGERFYQKDIPDYFPDWIDRLPVENREGSNRDITTYVTCEKAATLVYLANQACITPHVWLSRKDKLDYPDRMIFDLDPSDSDFSKVRAGALRCKALLEEMGLVAFAMLTGSKGVHVVVPLDRGEDFDTVRHFAQKIAHFMAEENSKDLTAEIRKAKRRGRVFIDTNRNAFSQLAVAPYAVRALPGAPVATPITWEELEKGRVNPQSFNVKNLFKHLADKGDPWKNIARSGRSLKTAHQKLEKL
jgi:bifunctional non-homologous end joining protein LigD